MRLTQLAHKVQGSHAKLDHVLRMHRMFDTAFDPPPIGRPHDRPCRRPWG